MRLFLLFSHKLTLSQKEYAKNEFGIKDFIYLPTNLQQLFSNIPPEIEDLSIYIKQFEEYLLQNTKKGDFVLIQGDFGLTYRLVDFCKKNSIVPIYATTKRIAIEKDGVKLSKFEFVRFRRY